MTTYRDVRDEVVQALTHEVKDFDVDAITAELIEEFNLTGPNPTDTFETIGHDRFWAIVATHQISQ